VARRLTLLAAAAHAAAASLQQCRELMPAARTHQVREQLRLWAEEFEEQTGELSTSDRVPLGAARGDRK
jgi:hypothetical protein